MTYKNWITIPNLENRYRTHYPILKEKLIEIVVLTVLSFFLIKIATVMSLLMLMSPTCTRAQKTFYKIRYTIYDIRRLYCNRSISFGILPRTDNHTQGHKQTDRETDRQTDRQTHTHTQKHTLIFINVNIPNDRSIHT